MVVRWVLVCGCGRGGASAAQREEASQKRRGNLPRPPSPTLSSRASAAVCGKCPRSTQRPGPWQHPRHETDHPRWPTCPPSWRRRRRWRRRACGCLRRRRRRRGRCATRWAGGRAARGGVHADDDAPPVFTPRPPPPPLAQLGQAQLQLEFQERRFAKEKEEWQGRLQEAFRWACVGATVRAIFLAWAHCPRPHHARPPPLPTTTPLPRLKAAGGLVAAGRARAARARCAAGESAACRLRAPCSRRMKRGALRPGRAPTWSPCAPPPRLAGRAHQAAGSTPAGAPPPLARGKSRCTRQASTLM